MNSLIHVRGKGLYVELHGPDDAPPLLYLHGGPGESCYEFMLHQTHRLSKKLHLIAIDQRGVWRSEAVEENEPLSLTDLVEDCEALRIQLGIKRWSILGHSFGGIVGLLYATTYPDSIVCVIFEGPSFDFVKSLNSMLKKAADIYESIGKLEHANECWDLLTRNENPDLLLGEFLRLAHGLGGELRMKIYTPGDGNNYSEYRYSTNEFEEFARRTNIHFAKLRAEGRMYESLLPRFKDLSMPTLLIKGKHDPVICEEQTLAFLNDVPEGELIIYEETGHLPHYEEPDRFANDVINFVQRWF